MKEKDAQNPEEKTEDEATKVDVVGELVRKDAVDATTEDESTEKENKEDVSTTEEKAIQVGNHIAAQADEQEASSNEAADNYMVPDTIPKDDSYDEEWMDGLGDEFTDTPDKTSGFRRILDSFIAPKKLADNIKYYQNLGSAILFILIAGLITAPFSAKLAPITAEAMDKSIQMNYTEDTYMIYRMQAEGILSAMPTATSDNDDNTALRVTGYIIAGIIGLITTLLTTFLTAFLLFIMTKIVGLSIPYMQIYALVIHLACITALGGLVSGVVSAALETHIDIFSFASFTNGDVLSPSFYFLGGLSVFSIWNLIYTGIGLATLGEKSAIRGMIAAAVVFVVSLGVVSYTIPAVTSFSLNSIEQLAGFEGGF